MNDVIKINDYKLMEWLGLIIIWIMIFTQNITRNWLGEIGNQSLFALIGMFIGVSISIIYMWKRRKTINSHNRLSNRKQCQVESKWRGKGRQKLKIVDNIREKIRERNKIFLSLDIFFTLLVLYLAIHVIFISISGLVNTGVTEDSPTLLSSVMFFCLGLTYVVRVVEMVVTGKKEYFILSIFAGIFIISVSVFMMVLEYIK